MSLPSKHRALVVVEKGKVAVKEQPLPKFSDDEILIRVKAVALNPTDWKHIDFYLKPGDSVGCDFAGDIVALGDNAKDKGLSIGDAVAGFTRGGYLVSDNGAFQEYVTILPESVWHKPDSLPYEDAAAMGGIALSTAVQALHHRLGLPYATNPISTSEPLLVWAGSTGVGMYAVKLASLSGYKVVSVASKKNFDLVKSLGADAVFDYNDENVLSDIQNWAKGFGDGALKKGLDTFSENGSQEKCVATLGEGGRLITLLPAPQGLNSHGADVHMIVVYSALKPKNDEDFKQMVDWNKNVLPEYLKSGMLSKGVVPLKVFTGGLDELAEAIDYVRQGNTSGHKVVVTLKNGVESRL